LREGKTLGCRRIGYKTVHLDSFAYILVKIFLVFVAGVEICAEIVGKLLDIVHVVVTVFGIGDVVAVQRHNDLRVHILFADLGFDLLGNFFKGESAFARRLVGAGGIVCVFAAGGFGVAAGCKRCSSHHGCENQSYCSCFFHDKNPFIIIH